MSTQEAKDWQPQTASNYGRPSAENIGHQAGDKWSQPPTDVYPGYQQRPGFYTQGYQQRPGFYTQNHSQRRTPQDHAGMPQEAGANYRPHSLQDTQAVNYGHSLSVSPIRPQDSAAGISHMDSAYNMYTDQPPLNLNQPPLNQPPLNQPPLNSDSTMKDQERNYETTRQESFHVPVTGNFPKGNPTFPHNYGGTNLDFTPGSDEERLSSNNDAATTVSSTDLQDAFEGRQKRKNVTAVLSIATEETKMLGPHDSYHENITGEEAKRRLKKSGRRSYLTRYSDKQGCYVLSVFRPEDTIKHFTIIVGDEQRCKIKGKKNDFKNVTEMLEHYEKKTLILHL